MMSEKTNGSPQPAEPTAIARANRALGRGAFLVVVAGLGVGLTLFLAGSHDLSIRIFAGTLGILIALPVINVLAVAADEIRRRDWTFALIAAGVLGLIAYSVIDRLK